MRSSVLTASVMLSIFSASLGSAETPAARCAVGLSIGTPAYINFDAQYSSGGSVLRLSGMHYGDLRGAQLSAIPYHFSARGLNLGAAFGAGYAALRHRAGPMSTPVTDEAWYFLGGLSLSWRGLFIEPAAWWGHSTNGSAAGPLMQVGYLFAIN